MRKFLIAAALICAFAAAAQQAAVDRIVKMAREDSRVMDHLDIICSRFGGRPIGSAAFDNASQWLVRELSDWGYTVTLEEAGQLGTGFNRDAWRGRMIGAEQMDLHFVTPSYTVGTRGVERGHVVIEPRTQGELNKMRGRLKGAWVLVNGESNGFAIAHGAEATRHRKDVLAKNDSLAKVVRDLKLKEVPDSLKPDTKEPALFYDEMVEAGVLGFIQAGKVPLKAHYDRAVMKEDDSRMTFDNLPAVPDIKLDEEQFARIEKLVRERRDIELEFDIRNHFRLGPVPYSNIIATMKGTKYPDQYVIVGAHLDSYDSATGGVDDGNGVSVVMEAARLIAKSGARPQRTIMFIFFAGEEFGLLGSQAWVKRHADMLPRISNMFNRDGGPMPYTAMYPPKSLMKEYEKSAKALNDLYPDIPFALEAATPHKKPKKTGGNDASSFSVLGVPAVQMNEWNDVKGSGFSYMEIWHTERDIYNKVIPEYQEQAAAAMALIVLNTANLSKPFPREEIYLPDED